MLLVDDVDADGRNEVLVIRDAQRVSTCQSPRRGAKRTL
jgi:hypothetical protein